MAMARIERVSHYGAKAREIPPHTEAVLIDEGRVFINTGKPITHWEIEVDTLADLARIANGEDLIVDFNDDGTVAKVIIYDDYIE